MKSGMEKLRSLCSEIAHYKNILSLMRWDQEVNMPPKGSNSRSDQMAMLSSRMHKCLTNPELKQLVDELSAEGEHDFKTRRNLEIIKDDITIQKKYPSEFVFDYRKTLSEAFEKWKIAREENNFKKFAPVLKKVVDYKLRETELLGYDEHPYDALLNQFDKGLTVAETDRIFGTVRPQITQLMQELSNQRQPDDAFLKQKFDIRKQLELNKIILSKLGYDMQAGRIDTSPHPFSTFFGPGDIRITTRLDENDPLDGLLSSIHEAGHAIYNQGLNDDDYGLPSGAPVSMTIHESQSRLYENHVGRSREFIQAFFPLFQKHFPDQFGNIKAEQLYKAMNIIRPSLIRTQSDELTYHLHIIIRYELERSLIEQNLTVDDLPEAWNEKYKAYLGVDVPNDSQGVLQDVHWSHGGFGYFPTYSLGSFYSAQFFNKAEEAIPGLRSDITRRDFTALKEWLNSNIHQHGRIYNSADLLKQVTGSFLNPDHFMKYAADKFRSIYGS